jgi:pentatricopeptide repeat protein
LLLLYRSINGKLQEAEDLFQKMLEKSLFPNSVIYTSVFDGHWVLQGSMSVAFEVGEEMIVKGLTCDVVTYKLYSSIVSAKEAR